MEMSSVVHRRPAAAVALDFSGRHSGSHAAAEQDDEGYSTVIFRNIQTSTSDCSALATGTISDCDTAYDTVIVRQPSSSAVAAALEVEQESRSICSAPSAQDPNRPAALQIPVSPHSASSLSPTFSPASVLISFEPQTTELFASPLSTASPGSSASVPCPSTPPCEPDTPGSKLEPRIESEEQAAVLHAVAFAHNRRDLNALRRLSESNVDIAVESKKVCRVRRSASDAALQGVNLGRWLFVLCTCL
jgi:hypothetical protein